MAFNQQRSKARGATADSRNSQEKRRSWGEQVFFRQCACSYSSPVDALVRVIVTVAGGTSIFAKCCDRVRYIAILLASACENERLIQLRCVGASGLRALRFTISTELERQLRVAYDWYIVRRSNYACLLEAGE